MTHSTAGAASAGGRRIAEDTETGVVALVREPQQDRSRRTLKRILDAGLYLLEHEGPGALTVTALTKRARTSVGSFYARFQGKDDLLRYLGERALSEALEVWSQLGRGLRGGGELRSSAADVVQRLGWLYLEGAGRSLVLLDGIEDPSPTRRRRLEDTIAEDLRDLGIASEVRSDLATRVVTGILQDAAVRSLRNSSGDEEGTPYPEAPILIAELVELLVGYLGGEVQAPALPEASVEVSLPVEPETTGPPQATVDEIATEALIEAALADEAFRTPPSIRAAGPPPEPQKEAAPPAPNEEIAEPQPAPELEPAARAESEPEPTPEATTDPETEAPPEPEPPPAPDPDPFDVWG